MKNIILIITLILINSCKAQQQQQQQQQQQRIKSLDDSMLTEKIITQFSKKANIKGDNSIFTLYFQEHPSITEVENDNVKTYHHDGVMITIYRFKSVNQIAGFNKDYDIYKKSNKIFYIFDKNSNSKILSSLKKNKISQFDMTYNNDGYDPKSWVITFNRHNKLEKCFPYNCN